MLRLLYPRGRYLAPIEQDAGWAPSPVWTGVEGLTCTGMRYPDRPVRSESSVTGLSDETHFHFEAYFNKHSVSIWPAENPGLTVTNPLHSN
jgi:hypothetical protein